MATVWEITAHWLNICSNCILTTCDLVLSRFGFEEWIWVPIASVPDLFILLTFNKAVNLKTDINPNGVQNLFRIHGSKPLVFSDNSEYFR